jgi:FAD:protein FMN transferase
MGGMRRLSFHAALLFFPLASAAAQEAHTFRQPCMGTVWTLKLYAPDAAAAEKAAKAAFARIEALNATLSDYLPQSELSRLSATAGTGKQVTVTGDLLAVLQLSQKAAAESGGAFDITIGPCVQLWRSAKKSRRLPEPAALAAAQAATGWESLLLDSAAGTVQLKKPGMKLDLGGIAKGYAQDEALALLRSQFHITSALLDAGGAVAVTGKPPGREGWNVQVAKPQADGAELILRVENACVATSGDLHQSVEIGGVRYSHLIDKTTGLGMTRPVQATVVAASAVQADWLATTLCLMEPDRGMAFLAKHHPAVQARISTRDGETPAVVKETAGFAALLLPEKK